VKTEKGEVMYDLEFKRLGEEYESAKDEYCNAFTIVNQKLISRVKPTKEEVAAFDNASSRWAEAERRLREFMKSYC
jgi:hypothetical protein